MTTKAASAARSREWMPARTRIAPGASATTPVRSRHRLSPRLLLQCVWLAWATGANAQPLRAFPEIPHALQLSPTQLLAAIGGDMTTWSRSAPNIGPLAATISPSSLDNSQARNIRSTAERWLAMTPWSGRLAVNEAIDPNQLNVLVINHAELVKQTSEISCNCQYVFNANTILCDGMFIANFSNSINFTGSVGNADDEIRRILSQADENLRQFLLQWILGHEIGHFILGHTLVQVDRPWKVEGGIPVGTDVERQADEYYISRLQGQQTFQFYAWLGLSNIITKLYSLALHNQHADEEFDAIRRTGRDPVFAAELAVKVGYSSAEHPPLLIRALNLATVALRIYPELADSTGYFDRVRRAIQFDPSWTSSGPSYCDTAAPPVGDDAARNVDDQVALLTARADHGAPPPGLAAALDDYTEIVKKLPDGPARTYWDILLRVRRARVSTQPPGWTQEMQAEVLALDEPRKTRVRLELMAANAAVHDIVDLSELKQYAAQVVDALRLTPLDAADPADWNDFVEAAYLSGMQASASYVGPELTESPAAFQANMVRGLARQATSVSTVSRGLAILDHKITVLERAPNLGSVDVQTTLSNTLEEAAGLAGEWGLDGPELGYRLKHLSVMYAQPDAQERQDLLAEWENGLARLLVRLRQPLLGAQVSGVVVQRIRTLLEHESDPALAARLRDLLLLQLNQQGWALMTGRRFADAVQVLAVVAQDRAASLPASKGPCTPDDHPALALATVQQNVADAFLGLGELEKARDAAGTARQCRTEAGNVMRAAESKKTEGLALYAMGNKADAKLLLGQYLDEFGSAQDNRAFIDLDPYLGGGYVNGRYVAIKTLAW